MHYIRNVAPMKCRDTDGTPDPTFGDQGKVVTSIGNFAAINSMAFDRQGRIVASGSSFIGTNFQFVTARYLNDLETGWRDFPNIPMNISVQPNPISESFLLHFTLATEETISVELLDMEGRILITFADNEKTGSGDHSWEYRLPSSLTAGNYFIRFVTSKGASASRQVSH